MRVPPWTCLPSPPCWPASRPRSPRLLCIPTRRTDSDATPRRARPWPCLKRPHCADAHVVVRRRGLALPRVASRCRFGCGGARRDAQEVVAGGGPCQARSHGPAAAACVGHQTPSGYGLAWLGLVWLGPGLAWRGSTPGPRQQPRTPRPRAGLQISIASRRATRERAHVFCLSNSPT